MKKGNLLLIIITFLIISIVAVYALIIIGRKNNQPTTPPTVNINVNTEIKLVEDRDNYYMVKNCVNKFYRYYATMFDTKKDEDIEKTYILLDKEYINFKGITEENMLTIFPRMGDVVVNITNMYSSQQTETISVYLVEGILREELTKQLSDFKIIIKIDSKNATFSVLLQDYIEEKLGKLELGNKLKIQAIDNLKENRYNLYIHEEISDDTYVVDLLNNYKENVLYNPELAYQHLDEEYRNQKFGTIKNFKEYAELNKERNSNIKIKKYQKTENNGKTKYVCVDTDGRYYIFIEKGIMRYNLILDTYTIDLPEFLEKYNSSNTVEKVGYNIQKCLDAINYKDYEYLYNKLDLEFKSLNYPTLESFEMELEKKLFNQNEVKKVKGSHEGETYVYQMIITDVNNNEKEQAMTVIMRLKEGTDFVMSLSFQ